MPADPSTSIAIAFAGAFALLLISGLVYSVLRLRRACLQLRTVLEGARVELSQRAAQLEGAQRELDERARQLEGCRQLQLEQSNELAWAAHWRKEWRRALLAQRWARSAACYEPSDPQRSIYSAAAVALLLARDVESVCRVMEQWIVETPKAADGVMERHTAESQAAQHWRVLVNEARDYMRNEVYWFVESEEGKPPPEQPPLEERLWRFLTGESPGHLDTWNVPQLERATLELLARAQLAGVEIAAKRGHPRGVAPESVH